MVTLAQEINKELERVYRAESRRVLATLIHLLGDFDLAEEALHEAFAAALKQWPNEGLPGNPRAWLVSTGRFKAIDHLRRRKRFDASQEAIASAYAEVNDEVTDEEIADDRLRLIFTCCHPSLSLDAQLALTLREVCDLTTEEIARAFIIPTSTLAQRIVRAKAKIRAARIPYEVPAPADLTNRLEAVLQVIYLLFNEGYSASRGQELTRCDLCTEAVHLGRLLLELLPEPDVKGLLALMLMHEARRATRATREGDLILLDQQDRSLWNREQINEASQLIQQALRSGQFGAYTLQAAIAGIHAEAPKAEDTDWHEIVGLYDLLLAMNPTPIIELNRAVALAMRDGPQAGLTIIDRLQITHANMAEYHLLHSARADLCRRLGRTKDAIEAYQRALALAQQEPERRFLERRLASLQ